MALDSALAIILNLGLFHTKINDKESCLSCICEKHVFEDFWGIRMNLRGRGGSSPLGKENSVSEVRTRTAETASWIYIEERGIHNFSSD